MDGAAVDSEVDLRAAEAAGRKEQSETIRLGPRR